MVLTEKQKKNFWKKVNKTDTCWLWTGWCNAYGHGQVNYNHRNFMAHRVSWLLAGNTIPDGHVIRHKCKSKNCLNPDHLETGTLSENQYDRIRDGTAGKLTIDQVREIRTREGEWLCDLAKEYGVSHQTIGNIIRRATWKTV